MDYSSHDIQFRFTLCCTERRLRKKTVPVTTDGDKVEIPLKQQETGMCPVVSWNEAWILLSPGQRSGSAALGDSEVSVLSPGLSFIRGLLQPLAFAAAAAAAHLPLRLLQQEAAATRGQKPARSCNTPAPTRVLNPNAVLKMFHQNVVYEDPEGTFLNLLRLGAAR